MVFIKDHTEFIFDFNFIRNVIFAENENLAAGFLCFVQNTVNRRAFSSTVFTDQSHNDTTGERMFRVPSIML